MDTAMQNALKRKDELRRQIDNLNEQIKAARNEIEGVDAFISAWWAFADEDAKKEARETLNTDAQSSVLDTSKKSKKPVNSRKEDVATAAREIILERGRPVSRSDLFKALTEKGFVIRGKNDEMVLSTMLWRMPELVVRLKPFGYWAADRPYPPAGYDPAALAKIKSDASRTLYDLL